MIKLTNFDNGQSTYVNPDYITLIERLEGYAGFDGEFVDDRTKIVLKDSALFLVTETPDEVYSLITPQHTLEVSPIDHS